MYPESLYVLMNKKFKIAFLNSNGDDLEMISNIKVCICASVLIAGYPRCNMTRRHTCSIRQHSNQTDNVIRHNNVD